MKIRPYEDVSGEGVQQALLKLIEACGICPQGGVSIPIEYIQVDANIMFICGGAFVTWIALFSSALDSLALVLALSCERLSSEK